MCTGWRRLIGSPKLQIIFHKRATKYRSLLWKMTYKDKGSYESSPPFTREITLNVMLQLKKDHAATRCNTLQHTACVLQHTATHCNILQHKCIHMNVYVWNLDVMLPFKKNHTQMYVYECVCMNLHIRVYKRMRMCVYSTLKAMQCAPTVCANMHLSFYASNLLHAPTILSSHVDTMGWLRLVGSLKWYVSFAKEPYKRDDILQRDL